MEKEYIERLKNIIAIDLQGYFSSDLFKLLIRRRDYAINLLDLDEEETKNIITLKRFISEIDTEINKKLCLE